MDELRSNIGSAHLELDRCMSCGLCLEDCPTYNITGRFTSSPRGRIRLMLNLSAQTLELDDTVPYTNVTVRQELDTCLGCLGCDTSCPADIRYSQLLDGLKATLFETDQRYREQLRTVLEDMPVDNPRKLRRLMIMLRLAQRTGMLWLARHTPLGKLLPERKRTVAQLLAKPIPAKPSSAILAPRHEAVGEKRMTVGVVLGCVNDHMFTESNLAMVRVLQRMGAEVIVPDTQACCGAIHQHMGDRASSQAMAVENCKRFVDAQVDAIAVNAAGCGSWIKDYAHAIPDDPVIKAVAPKFKDIHEIIWQLLEMNPAVKDQWTWPDPGQRVTYQDACHLVHGQGVSDIPRKLLQSISALEYVPLCERDRCCGSAGTYNILQPDMAAALQSRKTQHILDTGADIIAVGNPGCALQILAGLRKARRTDIQCMHPVQLIDRSWRSDAVSMDNADMS